MDFRLPWCAMCFANSQWVTSIHIVAFLDTFFPIAALLAIGVRGSSLVNNVFAGLNLYVITYVTICGLFQINGEYWSIPYEDVPKGHCQKIIGNKTVVTECDIYGDGGFNPYGFTGVMAGAAMCFYGFIGFDVISTASTSSCSHTCSSILFSFLFLLI